MRLLAGRLAIAAAIYLPSAAANSGVEMQCSDPAIVAEAQQLAGSGLLQLSFVVCGRPPVDAGESVLLVSPSPDAEFIARLVQDPKFTDPKLYLKIRSVRAGDDLGEVAFVRAPPLLRINPGPRSSPAFRWSEKSDAVLGVEQDVVMPGGFAISELRPIRVGLDGAVKRLPSVNHAAGTLDRVLWADGEGRALVKFGTDGAFYRPKHDDPDPTFGLANLATGELLDVLPVSEMILPTKCINTCPLPLDAVVMADGQMRALFDSVGAWVIWTEGRGTSIIVDPFETERIRGSVMLKLSPDGSAVFAFNPLTRHSTCPLRVSAPPGGDTCGLGPIAEGLLAAAVDIGTGKVIWRRDGRNEQSSAYPAPAITPDSRYAVIGLPPADERPVLAIIDLATGETVQTMGWPPGSGVPIIGFSRRHAWMYRGGVLSLYKMNE